VHQSRGRMKLHRAECEDEEVLCLCPGCDARLLRKGMDAHVEATHMQSAVKQLQILWRAEAEWKEKKRIWLSLLNGVPDSGVG